MPYSSSSLRTRTVSALAALGTLMLLGGCVYEPGPPPAPGYYYPPNAYYAYPPYPYYYGPDVRLGVRVR